MIIIDYTMCVIIVGSTHTHHSLTHRMNSDDGGRRSGRRFIMNAKLVLCDAFRRYSNDCNVNVVAPKAIVPFHFVT